jgi:hypothetical protein
MQPSSREDDRHSYKDAGREQHRWHKPHETDGLAGEQLDLYPQPSESATDRPVRQDVGHLADYPNSNEIHGVRDRREQAGTPVPAAAVTPFDVDLHEQLYRFRAGHRLMAQVQSTWFPL